MNIASIGVYSTTDPVVASFSRQPYAGETGTAIGVSGSIDFYYNPGMYGRGVNGYAQSHPSNAIPALYGVYGEAKDISSTGSGYAYGVYGIASRTNASVKAIGGQLSGTDVDVSLNGVWLRGNSSGGGRSIDIYDAATAIWEALSKGIIGSGTVTALSQNTATTITYCPIMGNLALATTEADARHIVPCAGVAKNFYVNVTANTANRDHLFTIYKNGVATSVVINVPATSTGAFGDTTNIVTLVRGDRLSIESSWATSGGAGSISWNNFTIMIA
jgi:hypothetical protein